MDFDWEDLLFYLEDRKIVPIVGPELLKVDVNGGSQLLDQYLGQRLAERLKVKPDWGTAEPTVSKVAQRFLQTGGERTKIYNRLHAILKERSFPVPDSLRKLAEISDFQLFVSTTPDSLLIQALNEVRFGGRDEVRALDYSSKPPPADLPAGDANRDQTTVFSLFGRASSVPEYAVTGEDRLEFLTVLQDKDFQPTHLFSVLRDNNLLFLGSSLPDWLVRFFVRTVKNERLADSQGWKFVADDQVRTDDDLVVFLELYKTQVFDEGGAEEFVDRLHRMWCERRPEEDSPSGSSGSGGALPPSEAEIFLSYAREDQEEVRELKQHLEREGLQAWIDEEGIPPASDWNRRIRQMIGRCSIFVPCLSRAAEGDLGSFFRREWKAAVDRNDEFFGSKRRFLWPVALDDLPADAENIPEAFRVPNWTRAKDPQAMARLVEELTRELREIRGRLYR